MASIGFIGAGKMAEALISKLGSPKKIIASDISPKRLSYLKKKYKIKTTRSNSEVFTKAKIIILAVKPQDMRDVRCDMRDVKRGVLFISIVAGIPLSYLQKKLPGVPVVRAMPNNPALVGMGVTAVTKGKGVSREQFKKAEAIFKAVGEVVEVKESLMDAVTGLSGSGPAYVYQFIESLVQGGYAVGLPRNISAKLAVMTVLGAAYTVLTTGKSPSELRKMVTSPGGTTIEGLSALKRGKFSKVLIEAVLAASKKSKKLSHQWTL
ncbi:MAG: pyrroline-5-carboxylate reductase [Candidatus Margulisiibacteriota bacterium]|nr:pyrroline-5-carboxylate reductase [Candidatus Margulisiibacteriota bacterium]